MKKSFLCLLIAVFTLATPTALSARESDPVTPAKEKEMPERVRTLLNRLHEIKDMDHSELTKAERKELRSEVKSIKAELSRTSNGIYLSIGAIIIIILLLILIL